MELLCAGFVFVGPLVHFCAFLAYPPLRPPRLLLLLLLMLLLLLTMVGLLHAGCCFPLMMLPIPSVAAVVGLAPS